MKDLAATASGSVTAPLDQTYALLSDFESYPTWFPNGVRSAEVIERDPATSEPRRIRTTLHASRPIQRDFDLEMAVTLRNPELVELRRRSQSTGDPEQMLVSWRLSAIAERQTRIELELRAKLDIPGFLPVGGLAQSMADGFLNAALSALRG